MNEQIPVGMYLHAEEIETSGKTKKWRVFDSRHTELGEVHWHWAWRCYVFEPTAPAIYNAKCLEAMAEFCKSKTTEYKAPLALR